MTKIEQRNKAQMNEEGKAIIEHETMFDDSMLPTADELQKLQQIKPELVDWVMERAEKEQDFRHEFDRERLRMAQKDVNGNIVLNVMCILFAFLIIVAGMLVTMWMLGNGMAIAGTIFAGGTIIGAAALFTRIPRKK